MHLPALPVRAFALSAHDDGLAVMADIIPFGKKIEPKKSTTLCRSGFHRWEVDKETEFLTRDGKLWTKYRCSRCGKSRSEWR